MKKLFLVLFCLSIAVAAGAKNLNRAQSDASIDKADQQRKTELRAALKKEWNNHEFTNGDFRMKFWDTIYGAKPTDGRSLYISLHGGGGAPPSVNDGQWRNQKMLYKPAEGLYFVPRSPTDSWNMWHQEYMDDFLRKTIASAVLFADVNPDKVYLLGYSAGGDGLYQLAPRMADHLAAGSMMAGHPGDADPASLRNLPFSIYMGGQDGAYDRNSLAREYQSKLDRLAIGDAGGYIHEAHIYEDCGHWMERRDTIAIPWMAQFTRQTYPKKVVWVQDDVLRDNLYWVGVPEADRRQGAKIVASLDGQTINIEQTDSPVVLVGLNDQMIDLDKPMTVVIDGKTVARKKFSRTDSAVAQRLNRSPYSIDKPYPVILRVEKNGSVSQL